MKETLDRLRKITEGCRNDMHEPDEQQVSAVVSGYILDNAMGDHPAHNLGELTVGIQRVVVDDPDSTDFPRATHIETEWFNLATLIALARKAELKNSNKEEYKP